MTPETFSAPSVVEFVQKQHRLSPWRRFINAIKLSRQRWAEEFVREYLQRHKEYHDSPAEIEQRRLGQRGPYAML